jgi:hypothetical protein
MRDPMRLERLVTLVENEGLEITGAGRITLIGGGEIGPSRVNHPGIAVHRLVQYLIQRQGADLRPAELLREQKRQGALQAVLIQHRGVQPTGKRGFL